METRILGGFDGDFANSFPPYRGLSPATRGPAFATVFKQNGGIIVGSLVEPADGELRSAVNILDLPGGLGCEAGGDLMGPYDHQIWSSSGSKYACAWDYGRARVIQQPVESTQVRSEERRVGKEWVSRVDLGGRRISKKKKRTSTKERHNR